MKTKTPVLILASALLAFAACKKYEQGPGFSLKSKTERASNKWNISAVYEAGADKTTDYKNIFYNWLQEIKNDGSYHLTYKALNLLPVDEKGKWSFKNDFAEIFFDKDNSSEDGSWTILKLMEKEVWVKTLYNGKDLELHLVPAP